MIGTRIKEIIDGFKKQRVLVVGDIMMDHYVRGKVERLNPEAPVPVLHAHEEWFSTGGAGNVAKNLAMLGGKALFVGVVGDDQYADILKNKSKAENYESVLVKDQSRSTTRKVRFLVASQQLLRVDHEKTEDISSAIENEVISKIKEAMKACDGVIISDYAKGTVTKKVAKFTIVEAKKRNIPVASDVKVSRVPFVVGSTLVSPNRKEGYEFLGLNHLESKISVAEVAKRLRKKMKANVFLTLGKDGICVSAKDGTEQLVPLKNEVNVFDESGAGDTSIAVMMLAMLSNATFLEMAELGNAGGSAVVRKIGSVGISTAELEKMAVTC